MCPFCRITRMNRQIYNPNGLLHQILHLIIVKDTTLCLRITSTISVSYIVSFVNCPSKNTGNLQKDIPYRLKILNWSNHRQRLICIQISRWYVHKRAIDKIQQHRQISSVPCWSNLILYANEIITGKCRNSSQRERQNRPELHNSRQSNDCWAAAASPSP